MVYPYMNHFVGHYIYKPDKHPFALSVLAYEVGYAEGFKYARLDHSPCNFHFLPTNK